MTSNNKTDMRADHMMKEIQNLHARVDQALQSTIRQNAKINKERENRTRYSSSLSPSRLAAKNPSMQTSTQNIPSIRSLHLNIPPRGGFLSSSSSQEQTLKSSKTSSRPDLNLSKFVFFNPFNSPANPISIPKKDPHLLSAPQTTRERARNPIFEDIFKRTPPQQIVTHQSLHPGPLKTCRANVEEERARSPLTEVRANIQNQIFVPKYNKEQLDQIISNIRKRNNAFSQQQQPERHPTPIIPLREINKNALLQSTRELERPNNQTRKIPIKIKNEIFGSFKPQNQPKTVQHSPSKERLESSTLNYQVGSEDWKMYPKYTFTSGDEDVQKILQFFDNAAELEKKAQKTFQARNENYYCGTLESDANESLRYLPQKFATTNSEFTEILRKRNHKRARSECMNIKSIPIDTKKF